MYKSICPFCNDTGLKVVHKQGDLIPGTEYREQNGMVLCQTIYASTLLISCDCCIIKAGVWKIDS